jgi:hypothetical protein
MIDHIPNGFQFPESNLASVFNFSFHFDLQKSIVARSELDSFGIQPIVNKSMDQFQSFEIVQQHSELY